MRLVIASLALLAGCQPQTPPPAAPGAERVELRGRSAAPVSETTAPAQDADLARLRTAPLLCREFKPQPEDGLLREAIAALYPDRPLTTVSWDPEKNIDPRDTLNGATYRYDLVSPPAADAEVARSFFQAEALAAEPGCVQPLAAHAIDDRHVALVEVWNEPQDGVDCPSCSGSFVVSLLTHDAGKLKPVGRTREISNGLLGRPGLPHFLPSKGRALLTMEDSGDWESATWGYLHVFAITPSDVLRVGLIELTSYEQIEAQDAPPEEETVVEAADAFARRNFMGSWRVAGAEIVEAHYVSHTDDGTTPIYCSRQRYAIGAVAITTLEAEREVPMQLCRAAAENHGASLDHQ